MERSSVPSDNVSRGSFESRCSRSCGTLAGTSVYVRTTQNKIFLLQINDADIDEVASAVRRWINDAEVQVYHLGEIARYVVNRGIEQFAMISTEDPTVVDGDDDAPPPEIVKFPIRLPEHD